MEVLDIYDVNRIKTGRTIRRDQIKNLGPGDYYQVVHLCIFNSRNQLLIQKRQKDKKVKPNMWDISVAGVSKAGELSYETCQRETMEELGYEINMENERAFFTINFHGGFDDYFLVRRDLDIESLTIQKEEVQEIRWASKEEVLELAKRGEFIAYYFLDSIFDMINSRGSFK